MHANHVLFSTWYSFDFTHPYQGPLIRMWSVACMIFFYFFIFVSNLGALFWLLSPVSSICPWCMLVFSPLPEWARDSRRYIFRLWVRKATTSSMGCAWDGWDGTYSNVCVEADILKPKMVVVFGPSRLITGVKPVITNWGLIMGSVSALSTAKIDRYWRNAKEKYMNNILNMLPHNCVERLVIRRIYWWLVSPAPPWPCFC